MVVPISVIDAEGIVQHFYCGSNGIGGTGSIGHHPVPFRIVLVFVDAENHAEIGCLGRSADDDPFSPRVYVGEGFFFLREMSCAFQDYVDFQFFPGEFGGVSFSEEGNLFSVEYQGVFRLLLLKTGLFRGLNRT